jgi:hypothetical protein
MYQIFLSVEFKSVQVMYQGFVVELHMSIDVLLSVTMECSIC